MTFQDTAANTDPNPYPGRQPDQSQPLTMDRPQTDPRLPDPYPKPPTQQPQYKRAELPPSLYIPQTSMPYRSPDEYGQDFWSRQSATMNPGMPQGPDIPSGLESYPTIAKSTGYLAKWGSDNVNRQAGMVSNLAMGFAPLLDMLSKGAFSRNFNASSLNGIKIQQARLIYETEQLQARHAEELAAYGSIIAKADALARSAKTASEHYNAIEDGREELRALAEQYGHGPLVAAIDRSGGLNTAKDFLKMEDAHFKDAWAGVTSLKKATGSADRDPETAEEFGISSRAGTGHGGMSADTFSPTPEIGGEPTEPNQPSPQTGAASDYDRDLMRKTGTSPQELEMARQLSMGQVPHSYSEREKIPARQRTPLENRALSDVNKLQNQITRDVEAAANTQNPNNDPAIAQQKFDNLRKANPALAAEISGLGTYNLDPKGEDRLGDRRYVNSLVSRFFPDYNSDNYAVMKKYKDESSPSRKVLTAANRAVQPITEFLKALKPMPETDSVPMAKVREWIAGNVENTGQYRELSIAMQQVSQQLSAITTGSGVTRVSIFNKRMQEMQGYVSPKVLRTILKQEAADIWGSIGPYQNTWETTFKRDDTAPGITKKLWQSYGTILLMNPSTGEMPPGAPPEFAAVSKNATKGVKEEEAWHPMSPADQRRNYQEAQKLSKNPDLYNPNSPNYATLRKYYNALLSRELSIINAPWERPDMD